MKQITTVEGLQALPVGSVVQSEQGGVFVREHVAYWKEAGFSHDATSEDITLPATLLTPDEPVAEMKDYLRAYQEDFALIAAHPLMRGSGESGESPSVNDILARLDVLAATTVDREAAVQAAEAAIVEAQEVADTGRVLSARRYALAAADAVLALLPATVDREEMRVVLGYAIARHRVGPVGANVRSVEDDALAADLVDAVLALLPAGADVPPAPTETPASVSTVKPDREWLMHTICSVTNHWDEPLDEVHDVPQIVNAILAAWEGESEAEVRADEREAVVSTVREFIVEEVGEDMGAGMTEQAERLTDAVLALLPATDRAIAALSEIRDRAKVFDDEACRLYGGDSPQALWAYGLREFIENALRDGE